MNHTKLLLPQNNSELCCIMLARAKKARGGWLSYYCTGTYYIPQYRFYCVPVGTLLQGTVDN